MSDLNEFLATFFEEAAELLDDMENGLMSIGPGNEDDETINSIFRAAHSIKGGAATFNLLDISQFTHKVETFMDLVRNHEVSLTDDHMTALFEAVDLIREIVDCVKTEADPDQDKIKELGDQFETFCNSGNESSSDTVPTAESATPEASSGETKAEINLDNANEDNPDDMEALFDSLIADNPDAQVTPTQTISKEVECQEWNIIFVPSEGVFIDNCEPLSTIYEVSEIARIKSIIPNLNNIPDIDSLDPEKCYLSWKIITDDQADQEQLEQVFWWYNEESKVVILQETGIETIEEVVAVEDSSNNQVTEQAEVKQIEETNSETQSEQPKAEAPAAEPAKPVEAEPEQAKEPDPKEKMADANNKVKAAAKARPPAKAAPAETTSIRVSIEKIDDLINMVGELVITQAMLGQVMNNLNEVEANGLREGLAQLEQNSRELQESVMRIRMLPVSNIFNRFPRLVRDIEKKVGKNINLTIEGEGTEIDKTVLEKINDPLMHLIRNCADHGLEPEDERVANGKDPQGNILLKAYHKGGNVMIEIKDDGRGLNKEMIFKKAVEKGLVSPNSEMTDEEVYECLFMPGFSTAEQVTDLSGRGVGMDVVKKNINALGGDILIKSKSNKGTTFTISLPLTLAILDGQTVLVGDHIYIIPLVSMQETIQVDPAKICNVGQLSEVYNLRDEYVPIIKLWEVLPAEKKIDDTKMDDKFLIIIETHGKNYALMIDDILAHQQVVIKSLEENYQKLLGISGATILGNGKVALIIDVAEIVQLANIDQVA